MNLQSYLEWMLPTGFMGSIAYWWSNRRTRSIELERGKQQVYKQMYEELKETVLELSSENREMRKAIMELEWKVSQVWLCRHRDECPLGKLQESGPERKYI